MAHFALVFGCDQVKSGLGPRTLGRLETALEFQQRTGAILVVAAGKANDFDDALGDLMVAYLHESGCVKFIKLDPEVHNTLGEAKAFVQFIQKQNAPELSVVSSKFHLWRIRMLLKLFLGAKASKNVSCVAYTGYPVSWREEYILEPIKFMNALMPSGFRKMCARILNRTGIRAQY